MKKYQEHKETGLDWLAEIPKHWDWLYLSQASSEQQIKNSNNQENNVLSLSYGNIINKKDINFGLVPKEYDTYQIVHNGNIILRLTDLQNDKKSLRTGLVTQTGIITSAYTCLKPKANSAYLHYLLHSFDTQKVFYGLGGGVRQSISYADIRNIRVSVPPKEEQDQIVKFLDYKISKINKFIKNKKKLIELLNEQKQAVINHAVTKGLNPHVEMKDSGIDWLGEVPKHWEVKPIKHFVSSNDEALTETTSAEFEFNYIDISSVGFGFLKLKPVTLQFQKAPSRARRIVKKGDTIISTVRTYLKSICFINDALDNHIVSTGFSVLRPKANVFPELLSYILASEYFINAIQRNSIGVSYPAISDIKLNSLKVVLPNNLEEQKEIYLYIQSNLIPYENMISKTQKEIDLIQEYKTSLISSVVTGQVDVRDVVVPNFIEEECNDIDEVIKEVEEGE